MDGTRERLVAAARQEFLEYGFRGASLRRIASAVGVTTGAIYGCFRDKAALLEAVVGEVYDAFMGNFLAAQDAFKAIPPEEQPDHVGMSSADYIHWAVGYMLEHRDEFRIILLGSEGTRFGRLIDEMVEIETAATNDFLSVLRSLPRSSRQVSPMLEHMVVGSMFAGFMGDSPARHEPGRGAGVLPSAHGLFHGRMAENYGVIAPHIFIFNS